MSNFSSAFSVGTRRIGNNQAVFVIAEIGSNHNGDIELAKRMIRAAADSGADCVKFQSFRADEFMADRSLMYEYQEDGMLRRESMYDMFRRLEIPLNRHKELFDCCRERGVIPLTSVADTLCLGAAVEAGAQALKLASEDFINYPLMEVVAQSGLPLLLSTGMADESEIETVMELLQEHNVQNVAFLHCVSLYPTCDNEAHLRRISWLQKKTGAVIGYSDHTQGSEACLVAVALGAHLIERHFTLDCRLPGPDNALSCEPEEFKYMVKNIRRVEQMIGMPDGGELTPREREARLQFRRSIVAARPLTAGTVLCRQDLALKRPGTGLHPLFLPELIGRRLSRHVDTNEMLFRDMLVKR